MSIEAVRKDISSGNLPIMLLTDLFDCKTLSQCEQLFQLVESRVEVWKEETFFNNVKNQMLRSCNDLLRRLPRSQSTVFGGRILEFLARFFPLFERSGLNLTSEFNQDNILTVSLQDEGVLTDSIIGNDSALEEGEMPSSDSIQVDYNLYRKFWQLQEFFRNPNLCYNKPHWKQFQIYTNDVLSAFSSYKLDSLNLSSLKGLTNQIQFDSKSMHFTRYLTNQKLLELQLSDSNFRRYILIQFLILFKYLTSYVKAKHETHSLNEDQTSWIEESSEKVLTLIAETPPNGEDMKRCIEHILKRSEFWCAWKNDGCPSLKEINTPVHRNNPLKRKLGDEIKAAANANKIVIGNSELIKLWNLCPDNWEACLSKKRIFTPTVEKYFENVVQSFNSMTSEERQKRLSEDSNFSWRALRLLSHKSPHFFTPSNQMVKPISAYLDFVIEKVSKDFAGANFKPCPDLAIDDAEDISNDELLKQVDNDSNLESSDNFNSNGSNEKQNGAAPGMINSSNLNEIAEKIKADWKKVASLLKFEVNHF